MQDCFHLMEMQCLSLKTSVYLGSRDNGDSDDADGGIRDGIAHVRTCKVFNPCKHSLLVRTQALPVLGILGVLINGGTLSKSENGEVLYFLKSYRSSRSPHSPKSPLSPPIG